MRKTKKGVFMIIMVLITTVMLTGFQVNAVSRKNAFDNIEYSSKDIPAEKLEQIVENMYGISDDDPVDRGNLLCIFGHNKANGTTKTIEHKYYSTIPKCKETLAFIEYCTRSGCDYFVVINQSVNKIFCCT